MPVSSSMFHSTVLVLLLYTSVTTIISFNAQAYCNFPSYLWQDEPPSSSPLSSVRYSDASTGSRSSNQRSQNRHDTATSWSGNRVWLSHVSLKPQSRAIDQSTELWHLDGSSDRVPYYRYESPGKHEPSQPIYFSYSGDHQLFNDGKIDDDRDWKTLKYRRTRREHTGLRTNNKNTSKGKQVVPDLRGNERRRRTSLSPLLSSSISSSLPLSSSSSHSSYSSSSFSSSSSSPPSPSPVRSTVIFKSPLKSSIPQTLFLFNSITTTAAATTTTLSSSSSSTLPIPALHLNRSRHLRSMYYPIGDQWKDQYSHFDVLASSTNSSPHRYHRHQHQQEPPPPPSHPFYPDFFPSNSDNSQVYQTHNDKTPDHFPPLHLPFPTHPTFSFTPNFPVLFATFRENLVERTRVKVKISTPITCQDGSSNLTSPCFSRQILQELVCLSEEVDEKFRVQIKGVDEESKFTCIRFIRNWPNLVQLWIAQPKKINDARLCLDSFLKRSPQTWVAEKKEYWSFCPFVGGFDFRVYLSARKEPICGRSRNHWRPSRMESECILGEGLAFNFPDPKCNFIDPDQQESTLTCWGSFVEGLDLFVVLGSTKQSKPQYTMRLPSNSNQLKEFWATFYFSTSAPFQDFSARDWTADDRTGAFRVREEALIYASDPEVDYVMRQVDVHFIRTDGGVCYDESDFCSEFAQEGRCVNSALHKFANYCKKSCGLCGHKADLVPSTRSECYLPMEYRDKWLLVETNQLQEVLIEAGQVNFSFFGVFICKSKHWKKEQYKMLSVYQQGWLAVPDTAAFISDRKMRSCTIRCVSDFESASKARSSLVDKSFNLCEFKDDQEPLADTIRSKKLKMLIPEKTLNRQNCGLHGLVNVTVSFPPSNTSTASSYGKLEGSSSCSGTLTDIKKGTDCFGTDTLTLSLSDCPSQPKITEFQCVGSMSVSSEMMLLITNQSNSFKCWTIFTYPERMSYRTWRLIHVSSRGQCGHLKDVTQSKPVDGVAMTIMNTVADSMPISTCQLSSTTTLALANKHKTNRKHHNKSDGRHNHQPSRRTTPLRPRHESSATVGQSESTRSLTSEFIDDDELLDQYSNRATVDQQQYDDFYPAAGSSSQLQARHWLANLLFITPIVRNLMNIH